MNLVTNLKNPIDSIIKNFKKRMNPEVFINDNGEQCLKINGKLIPRKNLRNVYEKINAGQAEERIIGTTQDLKDLITVNTSLETFLRICLTHISPKAKNIESLRASLELIDLVEGQLKSRLLELSEKQTSISSQKKKNPVLDPDRKENSKKNWKLLLVGAKKLSLTEKLSFLDDMKNLIRQHCYYHYIIDAMPAPTFFGEDLYLDILQYHKTINYSPADFSHLTPSNILTHPQQPSLETLKFDLNKFNTEKKLTLICNQASINQRIDAYEERCIQYDKPAYVDTFHKALQSNRLSNHMEKNTLTPGWERDFDLFARTGFLGCTGLTNATDVLDAFIGTFEKQKKRLENKTEETYNHYIGLLNNDSTEENIVQKFITENYKPTAAVCENNDTSISELKKRIQNLRFLIYQLAKTCLQDAQQGKNIAKKIASLRQWENTLQCALMMLFVEYVQQSIPTTAKNQKRQGLMDAERNNDTIRIWESSCPTLHEQEYYLNQNKESLVGYYNALLKSLNQGMMIRNSNSYNDFLKNLIGKQKESLEVGLFIPENPIEINSFQDILPKNDKLIYFVSKVIESFSPESLVEKYDESQITGVLPGNEFNEFTADSTKNPKANRTINQTNHKSSFFGFITTGRGGNTPSTNTNTNSFSLVRK